MIFWPEERSPFVEDLSSRKKLISHIFLDQHHDRWLVWKFDRALVCLPSVKSQGMGTGKVQIKALTPDHFTRSIPVT